MICQRRFRILAVERQAVGVPQTVKYRTMRVKTSWTAILILVLLFMSTATQARVTFQIRQDADEYAVYSVVINRAVSDAKAKFAAIWGTTVFDKVISNGNKASGLLQNLKPVTAGMLQDFIRNNRVPERLSENLKLDVRYVLLGRQSSRNDGGKASRKTWPASAIFYVSRVGFNDKRDLALVYFEINCGTRCAQGDLVLLSRGDRGWKIVKKYRLWIS
jgi:hypothetical protein